MGASLENLGKGLYAGAYVWKNVQGRVSLYIGGHLGTLGGGVRLPEI